MGISWVWLVLLVVFMGVEAITFGLVSIWFGIGSLAALITSFFTPAVPVQITVFFVVSFALILATFPFVKRLRKKKREPTNADRNIGRQGVVISKITPATPGRIKLDGVDWAARSAETLEEGTLCIVNEIDSTTVIVSSATAQQAATV